MIRLRLYNLVHGAFLLPASHALPLGARVLAVTAATLALTLTLALAFRYPLPCPPQKDCEVLFELSNVMRV